MSEFIGAAMRRAFWEYVAGIPDWVWVLSHLGMLWLLLVLAAALFGPRVARWVGAIGLLAILARFGLKRRRRSMSLRERRIEAARRKAGGVLRKQAREVRPKKDDLDRWQRHLPPRAGVPR